ncbi:MAG: serine hydrolase [Acidobacteriia bacterium]|nr:serine hydrolase [Terriglobia bacterium]
MKMRRPFSCPDKRESPLRYALRWRVTSLPGSRCYDLGVLRGAILATSLIAGCAPSLPANTEIDRFVRAELALNGVPGLALAIVERGEIGLVRAYGVQSVESGQPLTVDTPMGLASLSKALTALAILRLEQEGRIDRGADASEILPRLTKTHWAGVSLNHLLQHRSGLRRSHDFLLPCCGSPDELDLEVAVERLNDADLEGLPGESMSYANSNYVLLAAIIESVSGVPFSAYMQQSVFRPLGMRQTSIAVADPSTDVGALPHEWQWGSVRISPSRFLGWRGSSLVRASAADMAVYLEALLDRKPGDFEFLHADGPWWGRLDHGYDLGWTVQEDPRWFGDGLVLEHTGKTWGGRTAAVAAPQARAAVAVLGNLGTTRSQAMARGILRSLGGKDLPMPQRANRAEIPDTWAMVLLAAATGLSGLSGWFGWRTRHQLRSGRRTWRPTAGRFARSAVLGCLAVTLLYRYHFAGPPHAAFPTTIQVALPALVASVFALLLVSAVRGLTAMPARTREVASP